ncbi:leupaxin [Alosa sapidissima]|uniref:leupaxin n=1 Tax=Alosa sapidissima TaxID=34773 RepID=UPI001C09A4BD|nr:leupaxin [Alosa sapidissima]
MDELDLLLEELAQTSDKSTIAPGAVVKTTVVSTNTETRNSGYGIPTPAHTRTGQPSASNVYSKPSARGASEPMSPATATRELDSIMKELLGLDLEVPETGSPSAPPPLAQKERRSVKDKTERSVEVSVDTSKSPETCTDVAKPKKTDAIDDLLGGLSSDMEKMGVRTTAKGHCASCGKCIVGKMITALGQVWHPEHFVCFECKQELGTTGFFERDGKPYCEKDYQDIYSPKCAYCKGAIVHNILTAMDRTWHPEHFFCTHCGELFGTDGFMEKEGKPYCTKDFYQLFAPKCSGCSLPVKENYLTAANGVWHPDCFVCADCLQPFNDGCFLDMDGRPLCSLDFHKRQGTLCGSCGAPITGRLIAAMGHKFHPEHFVCAFCLRQLSQGVFQEQEGKPYCKGCHGKLFMTK